MNTKYFLTLAPTVVGLALWAGCATGPRSSAPQDTTKYTVENTEKFVLLDEPTQAAITCTGLQERTLPNGHIEIVANVKNRGSSPLGIQINCVFKDEQGFSIGDDTPLTMLTVAANSTEAVRFTAMTANAKKYTIRVRMAP